MAVKKGDKVKVEYEGSFDDGTVFDSSEKHGHPLEFEAGTGKVIKGFDDAIIGMKKGQEKKIKIAPIDAYGEPRPDLIKKIPRDQLPQGQEIKAGTILLMQLPNGAQMPVKVIDIDEKEAALDLNHPLAGKTLNFKLKVVE